jgi:DNA-binding MarR family transcriptional regulator
VNDLAALLYLDKSTASRIANSLVEKGYLARARDPEDGRVVRLVATPAGSTLCRRIQADISEEYAEMLSEFGPDVRAGIIRLVGRLGRSFAARVEVSGGSCCVVGRPSF